MKIAIITQPLISNYGGLLQNFALQKVLKKLGHSPITFDQAESVPSFIIKLKLRVRNFFSPKNQFQKFITKNICSTSKAESILDFKSFEKKYSPDAYIVGSDQVWRPKYNMFLESSFLAFTNSSKKIAYAASFGTDEWEYNEDDTRRYAEYLKKFTAVGVREFSAVELCKNYFHVDAELVLDPTLLLKAEDYDSICSVPMDTTTKFSFTYILDSEEWKRKVVSSFCSDYAYQEIAGLNDRHGHIGQKLSVEEWLSYLKHSSFVICDSFHGTVFSILMHRPFCVLANVKRGNARLLSILQALGLEDRLITNENFFQIENLKEIDWHSVDNKLDTLREQSMIFLNKALK